MKNMAKILDTNKYYMIDNESAFYIGYKYIYTSENTPETQKRYWLHEKLLRSLCIFNRETISNIKKVASINGTAAYLLDYVRRNDPNYKILEVKWPVLEALPHLYQTRFQERLQNVLNWVAECKQATD